VIVALPRRQPAAARPEQQRVEGPGSHYVISVAARMASVHPQTLRHYERVGLVNPARTGGNIRLYSDQDIQRLLQIKRLMEELGVNLAGVEVIMNMTDRMERQQREYEERVRDMEQRFQQDIERLKRIIHKLDKIAGEV